MCPDYFSMENPYSNIRTRSRKEDSLITELERSQQSAREYNSSKKSERVIHGPLKRFCGMCESPLVQTKKSDKLEGLDIEIPRYKCKTCSQVYSGFGLDLYTPNKKGKAIVFETDSVI